MEKMERYRVNSLPPKPHLKKHNAFLSAPSQISLPPKPHLRDPPISPYLEPQRQTTTAVAGAGAGDGVSLSVHDSEISIFGAERYFKEGQDSNENSKKLTAALSPIAEKHDLGSTPRPPESSVSSLDGRLRNSRNRSFHAAPTVSSEASWNSQTGLLKNPPGSFSVSVRSSFQSGEQKKGYSSSSSSPRRHLFPRSCPCIGGKSVKVEENHSDPKSSPLRPSFDSAPAKKQSSKAEHEVEQFKLFPALIWPKEHESFRFPPEKPFPSPGINRRTVNSGGFSFPIFAPSKEKAAEDPARVSLEVFQPNDGPASPVRRKSEDYQKTPTSLLSGDDRRSFNLTGSPKLRSAVDDDLASDTSSDLFEIESLSTQMACRRRESVDDLSLSAVENKKFAGTSAAGTLQLRRSIEEEASECYAPSEVSVEWSVTTAEGFDRTSLANFSSGVSEFVELRTAGEAFSGEGKKKGIGGAGGLLISCRSQKAVSAVAPNQMRFGPEPYRRTGASVFAVEPDPAVLDGAGIAGRKSVRMSRTAQPINRRVY
ncbi:Protein PHYTOCHROME KINASE SUBSTRATE 4 [Platanthera zijinensis]|uniref:Protein PHYTOCHROME KINASE SUBSTRATE 4 n=1 Tax=Platanthera zijinensis TaxID=2320716 RepID=A0AAP0BKA0_9ASPA